MVPDVLSEFHSYAKHKLKHPHLHKVLFHFLQTDQKIAKYFLRTYLPVYLIQQGLSFAKQPAVFSKKGELYYWHNELATSNAEVDFITIHNKMITPIEVKSKIKGGMKSLKIFLSKHPKIPYGIKISEGMFAKQDHLREIPLYGVKNI